MGHRICRWHTGRSSHGETPGAGERPPLPDSHWATVAYHYVAAIEKGVPIHQYIREQMSEGAEHLPTENWVAEARKRGFLTKADKQGRRGGVLTPKGRNALVDIGILPPPATESSTEKEGTT